MINNTYTKRQMISMKKIFGVVLSVLSVASVVGFIFIKKKEQNRQKGHIVFLCNKEKNNR